MSIYLDRAEKALHEYLKINGDIRHMFGYMQALHELHRGGAISEERHNTGKIRDLGEMMIAAGSALRRCADALDMEEG